MRTNALAAGLLAAALLSACATSSADPTPTASPCPLQSDSVETQEPEATTSAACPGGTGPGGQSGSGGPGGGNAPGGDSVTLQWSETVEVNDAYVHSVVHQSYTAVLHLTLTGGDGSWTFTGSGDITAAFTSDYTARMADILGAPCDVHYTDDASASGTVQVVDGGLTASDGFYDFYVNIPGVDTGTNNTVRDDSECDGPNVNDSSPWSAAPTSASGSGEYTGTTISGSSSVPRTGGEDTVTWTFTIPN